MKKSLKKLIWSTAAAAAALGFSSCTNIEPDVYGPPPSDTQATVPESSVSIETTKAHTPGTAEETTVEEPVQDTVSESAGESQEESTEETAEESTEETGAETPEETSGQLPEATKIDPSANVVAPVYGPPKDVMVAPVPDFDPAENIPEDVYGPPSFFGLPEEEEVIEELPEEGGQAEIGFKPEGNLPQLVYGPPGSF